MNFCSLKGYNNETFPSFSVEDKKTGNKCHIYSFTASYYFYIFMSKVHVSLNSYERASWKKKKIQNQKQTKQKTCAPIHMAPPYQREGGHGRADIEIYKSGRYNFAKSLNPELTCSPREAMLDEDGYITLNVKNRKPALTSGKDTQSQGFGS